MKSENGQQESYPPDRARRSEMGAWAIAGAIIFLALLVDDAGVRIAHAISKYQEEKHG